MKKNAIYPRTFDPITYGHVDIIKKALNVVDTVIVAISDGNNKNYLFNSDERIEIIKKALFLDLKLNKNEIAGSILDVFSPEPIEKNSKLWDTPNLIITPHVSSDDHGNYVKMTLEIFVKNLVLFVQNKELNNRVDKKLGY